ncbi:hypothetical protein LVJ94_22905 [Pendulispora rubella]|uniref:Uncharacterized protein n=1 Tax=Pendulispora rubella TaxID=2741070 RepID=A0ABZ2LKH3_9BACT
MKSFAMAELPLHVRGRFVAALERRGEPSPLLVAKQALFSRLFRKRAWVFLLPLDLVEVRGERVRLVPMGGLRKVNIEREPRRDSRRVVLVFEGGESFSFRVANETAAQRAYENIVHAQGVLKSLSIMPDLAQAVALDPFFALRSDPAWEKLGAAPRVAVVEWRRVLATVAVGAGLVLAGRAMSAPRPAIVDPVAARAVATPLPADTAIPEVPQLEEAWRSFGRDPAEEARERSSEKLKHRLAEHVTPAGRSLLDAFLANAKNTKNPRIYIEAEHLYRGGQPIEGWDGHDGWELERHTERVARAFGIALSQYVPSDVLEVVFLPHGGEASAWASVISIEVMLAKKKPHEDETFVFTVSVNRQPRFTLTLAPPTAPLDSVRNKSLFSLPTDVTLEKRHRLVLDARAFDRLYDELFGLFFTGDPIVPLGG